MITVAVSDATSVNVLLAYCVGKSWIFNLFFGWRRTSKNTYFFKLPKNDWMKLKKIIQENY